MDNIVQTNNFAHFIDLIDEEALARYRDAVWENDGHSMAVLNHNSLRRIIARLDRAESLLAPPPRSHEHDRHVG